MLGEEELSLEEFGMLARRAGLGLSQEELVELKSLYQRYLRLIGPLRSLNLEAEEIGMAFRPDWPSHGSAGSP